MGETQPVTDVDISAGRIRIPRSEKSQFPEAKGEVVVVLKGQRLDAKWDPRMGPDKERSGVVSVGKQNLQSLHPGVRLAIARDGDAIRLG